ncbi:hypothetical protein L596_021297 [Steinernema carpocapsae]|uniref:Uncharacterized protein n=1 Tax=Steinernema carpocapsae TaxID=34508 RepID=A0A4U5MI88_STECR|nr:hypothetical protein L596_021297 [Steinernema carpocapsae]
MLVGYNFEKTNMDEFLEITKASEKAFTLIDVAVMQKSLMKLPVFKQRLEKLVAETGEFLTSARRQIKNRNRDIENGSYPFDTIDDPQDFVDTFLMKMKRRKDSGKDSGTFQYD